MENIAKKKFSVEGMTCSACSAHVEKDVSKMNGVIKVEVSLMTNSMVVEYDHTKTSTSEIIDVVNLGGYHCSMFKRNRNLDDKNLKENKLKKKKLIASLVLMIILMYFSMGKMLGLPVIDILHAPNTIYLNAVIQIIIVIPIMILNNHYFINGFKRLVSLSPNMDTLIAIGSGASFVYGIFATVMMIVGVATNNTELANKYHMDLYFESSGMILTLVSLGKYLENKSKGKTTEAIGKLVNLAPTTAIKIVGEEELTVDVDELVVGDVIIVKPGSNIPVDGIVIDGLSSVDEASLTGEAIPVLKDPGSAVKSGTTNINGVLKIKCTCESNDSTLNKIIDLVESVSNSKAPIAALADKVSLYFVPIVIAISIITFIVWILISKDFEFSLARSISVLVISCPCALGLATPVAIMVGTYKAVNYGLLIKSSEALEILHKVDTIVLDKTGTITYGRPNVTGIHGLNLSEEEVLKIAYSLEKNSEHPLSLSIVDYAKSKNIEPYEVTQFENILGKGIIGTINNRKYLCGNDKLLISDYDHDLYQELTSSGQTVVFLATEEEVLGLITIKDQIKPESIEAVKSFNELGLETYILTGDNFATASKIAHEVGITNIISDVLPDKKAEVVEKLQNEGKKVAMVGDGINDSIALIKADVGIAMGNGTDIAIDAADIILMNGNLNNVATSIRLSKNVISNIKMNLFWAFFYNSICIPIACGVLVPIGFTLNPMIGAIAMSMSSVCVVLNALRIKKFK